MFNNMSLRIALMLPYSPLGLTEIFQKIQFCKKQTNKGDVKVLHEEGNNYVE